VPGELVLTLGSTASGQSIWVYADGRIIWSPFAPAPAGAGPSYVGFSEQRLTPSGVDFLQATVRSTGLFASDLMLAREGSYTPFVQIRLRNGSRLVEVTWAWRGIAGDAPVATAAQESALKALDAQLTDPASWPKNAWKDPVMRDYVPAEYVVCFGIPHGDAVVTARPLDILTLLPAPARDLIRIEEGIQQDGMHADYGCAQLTTDEASAFARILDDAGILRERPPAFAPEYLKYHVRDPLATNVIWIQFGAVLPQGEAVYLGPG